MKSFLGKWQIEWMEVWGREYIDLIEKGHFKFDRNGQGSFVFGAVYGWMDCRYSADGRKVEYSWQGECEGDDYSGRGWFYFCGDETAVGHLYLHCSDDSPVKLRKIPPPKRRKKLN